MMEKILILNSVIFNETENEIAFLFLNYLYNLIKSEKETIDNFIGNSFDISFSKYKEIELQFLEKMNFQQKKENYSVIIIFTTISTLARTLELAKILKSTRQKEQIILLTGPISIKLLYDKYNFSMIDDVLTLENNSSMIDILRYHKILLIDTPKYRLSLFNNTNRIFYNYKENNTLPIIAGVGCKYNCSFCDYRTYFGSNYSFIDSKQLFEQILKNYKAVNKFKFLDSSLTSYPELELLCKSIIDNNIIIEWSCFGRVNEITNTKAELMYKAGCKNIILGLESGSDNCLTNCNKEHVTKKIILEAIKILKNNNIIIGGSFIIGIPNEKIKDIEETISFAESLNLDKYYWHTYFPKVQDILLQKENHPYVKLINSQIYINTDIPNHLWNELIRSNNKLIYHRHALTNITSSNLIDSFEWKSLFSIPVNRYIKKLKEF